MEDLKIQPGRYGNLTFEQKQLLKKMINTVKEEKLFCPERHTVHYFLRFLRARNFDFEKSMTMFRNCEKWRVENDVDDIYKNFVYEEEELVFKMYPKFYHGVDLQGRPIYVEQYKNLNLKKLFEVTDEDRLIKNLVLDYEGLLHDRFPSCSNAAGHHIETGFTILDLKDVGIFQFSRCFNFIKRTSQIASDYYPEVMGNLFVINAPKAFSMCWKLIKGILDPVTVSKIDILGSNYKKVLSKFVDIETLPTQYGGKCCCSGGCEHSNKGPWLDPVYHVKEKNMVTIEDFLAELEKEEQELNPDHKEKETKLKNIECMKRGSNASTLSNTSTTVKSENEKGTVLPTPPLSPSTLTLC